MKDELCERLMEVQKVSNKVMAIVLVFKEND